MFPSLRDDIALRRKPTQVLVNLSSRATASEFSEKQCSSRVRCPRGTASPRTPKQWHIQSLCGTPSSRATPAHLFHPEASAEATAFVRQRPLRVLPGQTKSVLAVLRPMALTLETRSVSQGV